MYTPVKSLGQNFLLDLNVARRMVYALGSTKDITIIEIGPGLGVLTDDLLDAREDANTKILAVEIDTRFVQKLTDIFETEQNVDIIEADILSWLPTFQPEGDFKVIGSLPYYITSPIIHSLIKMAKQPEVCIIMIQKEVAQKIAAPAPDSCYMSAFVQTFFNVEYIETVPRNLFNPAPEVDGGILKLTKRQVNFDIEFINKYEGFLHKGFSNPRKMINKAFKSDELELGGIKPSLRAQDLSADEWLAFYRKLNAI